MEINFKSISFSVLMLAILNLSVEGKEKILIREVAPRIINRMEVHTTEVCQIMNKLSLTVNGDVFSPMDGRIATNLIVPTKERGKILLRMYPSKMPHKLETGNLEFEIAALQHLSQRRINVPRLLQFNDGRYKAELNGKTSIAYPFIEGCAISKEELSVKTATISGNYLASMIKANQEFKPEKYLLNISEGDLDHIVNLYNRLCQEFPSLSKVRVYSEMASFVSRESIRGIYRKSPQGIVHADYFFENLILKEEKAALIDFSDAYYGAIVTDVAIGAMEFSAVSEEKWDFSYLKAFLAPIKPWLRKYEFTKDDLINVMRANCLRFAIYTMRPTLQTSKDLEYNPYARRFKYLSHPSIHKLLEF
ncbi:phosphotransferase [Candidatus Odyssella thessalonicensis]|uniref:phosphotransferase n=1 Tax=Candidatus Odyssella thessalonicensis TaxID=84647 RepID=UPI000225A9A3|nr:phosphotransferase [Candidatus Odyssella thessalonicensis]